jgi:hypothetical protein
MSIDEACADAMVVAKAGEGGGGEGVRGGSVDAKQGRGVHPEVEEDVRISATPRCSGWSRSPPAGVPARPALTHVFHSFAVQCRRFCF